MYIAYFRFNGIGELFFTLRRYSKMEEKTQMQNEISLTDVLKMFLRKLKVLILALLIGTFVGAGFGVLSTYNVKTYGSTIEFYVNPRLDRDASTQIESQYGVYGAYGRHVMDNMVRLLSSELFAEQLLLNPETGLPYETEEDSVLNEKIAAAKQAKANEANKIADVQNMNLTLSDTNILISDINTELNAKWSSYRNAKLELGVTISSSPALIDSATTEEELEINSLYTTLNAYKETVKTLKEEIKAANIVANNAAEIADEKTEEALEEWRTTDELYDARLTAIMKSVTYYYYEETALETKVEDLARSFIYVDISVTNGESFAKGLRQRIVEVVPQFVEANMAIPSGYDGTSCQRITRSDAIKRTNEGAMLATAIKYAVLLAIVSLVAACVVVIIVERSDKRLRTIEQVSDTFNLPVLGVIPTIGNDQADGEKSEEAHK